MEIGDTRSWFASQTGDHSLSSLEDEVERRLAERIGALEDVCHDQKMEALGELTARITHDFQNLFMGIQACASIATSKLDAKSSVRRFVDDIVEAARTGSALARQLLALSNANEGETTHFPPNELFLRSEDLLRRLFGDVIELVLDLGVIVGRIHADRAQLEQVVLSLALSSRDALFNGGRVRISTREYTVTTSDLPAEQSLAPGRYVVIRFVEHRSTESGEDKSNGNGGKGERYSMRSCIGLSIVYNTVQRAGGRMRVREEADGRAFELFLPLCEDTVRDEQRPDPNREPAVASKKTVLLVEDEPMVRMVTRHFLSEGGYEVLEASTGSTAVQVCRTHQGPIHLLITDMVLPVLSGSDVARAVRTLRPNMRMIFMSAHSDQWLISHGYIEPGCSTLQKPFDRDVLLAKVSACLRTSSTDGD
jgi:CheY-like chemotaxis protein